VNFNIDKEIKLKQILYVTKLSSLVFAAIAFFQYYFKDTYKLARNDIYSILTFMGILLLFYGIWSFFNLRKTENKIITIWLQPFIFICITFFSVLLTGEYQSNYKFMFLFIIISTTIEFGINKGLVVSSLSSFLILCVDLFPAPHKNANTYFENDIVLACVFLIIAWTIGYYVKTEKEHIASLSDMVNIDGLTGLYNHRYFYDSLNEKIAESNHNKKPLSLLFIDIDYFKYYNDFNGHQKGDEVLKIMGEILRKFARKKDIVSRYGGEEFAIILPETTEEDAILFAEKLRFEIQEQSFHGQEYLPNENLTISLGVSVYPDKAKTEVELIKYADEALYRAKFLRKNRVEGYSSILDDLKNDVDDNNNNIVTSIKTLIAVINSRDKYTFRHVERVVSYISLIADKLELDGKMKKQLIYGAYMHDIGKINTSKEILMKVAPLTSAEWEELKNHPRNGAEIIKSVKSLQQVVPIILQHHEKYDGTGYPNGLKGEEISYLARILTVVDCFDAMTSNRPYRSKMNFEEAIKELIRCSGTQFDPNIVDEFISVIKENAVKTNLL
jgi:diguanylate cyclase (GGDEF)-like protein/putative nucleotidyltransferase with HDIG domain